MASISTDQDGNRTLLVVLPGGKRKALRMGGLPVKACDSMKMWIERLVSCKVRGVTIDPQTASWLAGVDDRTHATLARWGLCEGRERVENVTLGKFITDYIASRVDAKPRSIAIYQRAFKLLTDYFGRDRHMANILPGNVEDFRLDMIRRGYAINTTNRTCGFGKQFFRAAIRRGLLTKNPFEGISCSVRSDEKRRFYIDDDMAAKVLNQIGDRDIRLAFVLARFGGFRIPSELVGLRWTDVMWDSDRMRVRSPKTEKTGQSERIIPLFPNIKAELLTAFEQAEAGAEFVIGDRRRSDAINLRKALSVAIERAGLKVWPKLWVNLRSSFVTDLTTRFPAHVVAAWAGHTIEVSRQFYMQVRDEDFTQAVTANCAQICAQSTSETVGKRPQASAGESEKSLEIAGDFDDLRADAEVFESERMHPEGLEPSTF